MAVDRGDDDILADEEDEHDSRQRPCPKCNPDGSDDKISRYCSVCEGTGYVFDTDVENDEDLDDEDDEDEDVDDDDDED